MWKNLRMNSLYTVCLGEARFGRAAVTGVSLNKLCTENVHMAVLNKWPRAYSACCFSESFSGVDVWTVSHTEGCAGVRALYSCFYKDFLN